MARVVLRDVLFSFEEADESLQTMPLAARRALDHSGVRLAVDAYQSMPLDTRRDLALAGAEEVVDVVVVRHLLAGAGVAGSAIRPQLDPDPLLVPEQLNAALGRGRTLQQSIWCGMTSLERYALTHVLRRAIARNDSVQLASAIAAIRPNAQLTVKRSLTPAIPASAVRAKLRESQMPRPPAHSSAQEAKRGTGPEHAKPVRGSGTRPVESRTLKAVVSVSREVLETLDEDVLAGVCKAAVAAARQGVLGLEVAVPTAMVSLRSDVHPERECIEFTATGRGTDARDVELAALQALAAAGVALWSLLRATAADSGVREIVLLPSPTHHRGLGRSTG